ncbi:GPI transamidase subunit PIG-U isoform 3 [Hibiscus syriacus]|uniref:GPI transamidase subunit PIG-U isoform 3 n=1 Tax=Hibiscus syriacus TaxID=106335 RepID=A0A6A3AIM2_HIBSY|nr:GPI transamidase subunit PIG-U isoform 3 [Hibiscus syriacus]
MEKLKKKIRSFSFWNWVIASIIFRLILIYFPNNLNLSSRPEVSTPLTSFRRLSEGYWLKQLSMSPYAGSMYHGSPLLLSLLGPLTVKRIEGQPNHLLYSLVSVIADVVSAMLIRATGQNLQVAYFGTLKSFDLVKQIEGSEVHSPGDVAALIYLCNPFTIVACIDESNEWLMGRMEDDEDDDEAVFVGRGPDAPPRKLFLQMHQEKGVLNQSKLPPCFSWGPIIHFAFWALLWSVYVLVLCGISLKQFGGLWEMFKSTYGFILTVEDLSPNIGVLWYFFAEVFEFFWNFFLIVFHANILFMILPLAIRLHHRPCYLAYVAVGDSALYSDMQFSLFLFCGYVGVSPLSPVMHNLWIWRGTGNANFYFATTMVYACLQEVRMVSDDMTSIKGQKSG